jgi:hypothetical protein
MASKKYLRISSSIEGFRRAGIAHSRTATDHPLESFSARQLAQLEAEPNLIVQQIEKDIDDDAGDGEQTAPSKTAAPAKKSAGK